MEQTIIHHPNLKEKLFFFFSGAIISTPFPAMAYAIFSLFIRIDYPMLDASVLAAVLIAPFIEEFAKIYPLFYRHGETSRSIFSLAFLTGLGFGVTEFLLYVFAYHAPVAERLPLILFHATNTSIIAFGISRKRAFTFYLVAVVLHAIYNSSLYLGGVWDFAAIGAVVLSYLLSLILWGVLRAQREVILDGHS